MGELRSEILYNVLNYVGKDVDTVRPSLLKYLQDVFHVDSDNFEKLLQTAKHRQSPEIYLDVSVMHATVLKSTDVNGLSDPFCVLYLASKPTERCSTSIQLRTLNPAWNESFEFQVQDPRGDILCLEIWDFDEEETISEKMKKLRDVKDVRGLKLYWKEVKVAVASGRNSISSNNEFVGSTLVSLKEIPSCGITKTCSLDKNGKVRKQGDLTIHLSFSLKNDPKITFEQYRYLLYNVLLQELKTSQQEFYNWSGVLSDFAHSLLLRHETQCSISSIHVSLARWIEHVHIHEHHPLNLKLFLPLLQRLLMPLEDNLLNIEQKMLFWEAVTKLLPSCLMAIKRIQMLSQGRRTETHPLEIIRLVSQLAKISRPANINLFPKSRYSWLPEGSNRYTIPTAVAETISVGAKEWFMQTLETNNVNATSDEDEQLNCVTAIIDTTCTSLQNTLDRYEQTFMECFHFSYAEILYKVYQANVMELVEPIVTHICKSMKPIIFNDASEEGIYDNDPLTIGSTLFILYKKLRKLAELGSQLCSESTDLLLPTKFYEWYNPALVQWIYICSYKAKHHIQNAVKLDHNDNTLQTTTSAIDVFGICQEIRIFWNDLAWPDPHICCVLLTKLIEDICECLSFYAMLMVKKAKSLIENDPRIASKFRITEEWCLTVKNIRHIQKTVPKFVEEFKLDEVVTAAISSDDSFSPDDCKLSVLALINNCIEECDSMIEEMMDRAVGKLLTAASRLFLAVGELTKKKTNSVDEMFKYLEDNLYTLHEHLQTKDFQQIINMIWNEFCDTIYNLVNNNMNIGSQSSFFMRVQEISEKLIDFFSQLPVSVDFDMNRYSQLKRLLAINRMSAHTLIHEYYLEQLAKQKAMQDAKYGILTIKVQFLDDILRLEISSGRHLQPICPNGMCDPYVRIRLLPQEKFTNIGDLKTKILNRTTSPQFEEKFEIPLNKEQRNVHNGMILFTVKHVILLKLNYILGEALLSFDDIPSSNIFSNFDSLGEKQLTICRPTANDSEVYSILKHKEDKAARDFIRSQTNRYPQ